MNENSFAVFENCKIGSIFYGKESKTLFFPMVDNMQVLVQQPDYQTAHKYLNKLKKRMKRTADDNKMRRTMLPILKRYSIPYTIRTQPQERSPLHPFRPKMP